MSDPISLTFGFERKLFSRAMMAFWSSAVPRPSTSFRLIFWMVVWLGILAAVITVGALEIPPIAAGVGAVLIFGLWILALQRIRMAKFYDALGQHWHRTGDMTAQLDKDGIELTQEGTLMRFEWAAVDDVVKSKGATVFRIGMSMITIPDAALPVDLSAKDFRSRISDWKDK